MLFVDCQFHDYVRHTLIMEDLLRNPGFHHVIEKSLKFLSNEDIVEIARTLLTIQDSTS